MKKELLLTLVIILLSNFNVTVYSSMATAAVDVNVNDQNELNSQLIIEIHNGNINGIENLIAQGADVNNQDKAGYAPLHQAIYINGDVVSVVNALLLAGANLEIQNDYGITPLLHAVGRGHCGVVKALLLAGANVNHQTEDGWNSLKSAVAFDEREIVDDLIKYDAQIDCKLIRSAINTRKFSIAKKLLIAYGKQKALPLGIFAFGSLAVLATYSLS